MYKIFLRIKLLVVFCFVITACASEEVSKGEYLKKGISFFEQGQYKKSELEIKNAIQEDPNIAEAYFYLALVDEKNKKFKAMRKNLLEAVRLDPDSEAAQLKLGKVFLLFNELDEALKQVDILLTKNPEQLDALSLKASIFLRQEKNDEALKLVDQVLQKDAGHIDAVSLKTLVLMKNKAFDEALALLTPVLKNNENNISLHVLKMQLDSQKGDVDMLVADYEKLVELGPDDIKVKVALANIYLKANKVKQGEDLLRSLQQSHQGVVETELALLNYLYSVDSEDGLNQLDIFVKNNKENITSLTIYSKWLLSKNELSRGKKLLNSIISQNDEKARDEARLILAKLEISQKSFDKALEYIDSVERDNPSNQNAKLLKAQVLFATEKFSDAKIVVETILWQKPDMDQALSLLGSIYLVQGELDKAYANYKEALKISPKNLAALSYIVRKEVREEHVDYAIELLERTLKYLPSQLNVLTQLIELYGNKKEWDKVDKYIERVSTHKNGDVLSAYLSAKALYKKDECAKAVVAYAELLEKSPWVKDALIDMAQCYSVLKQEAKMDNYLNGFIKKHPNMIATYLLKSQMMMRSKQYKDAISFIRHALKNNSLDAGQLNARLGRLYAIVGDKNAEYTAYVDGLKSAPNNTGLLMQLAAYYEQGKVFDKAVEQYKKILLINSRHNVAKNNLATIYLDHYGDAEHVKNALQLSDVFKQSLNPYFLDTYGWAQLKNGDMDIAMTVFKKVIVIASNTPVFRYHLAVGYYQLGDKLAAISELKQAIHLGKGKAFPERKVTEELLAELK